jgi:hypothetical protein
VQAADLKVEVAGSDSFYKGSLIAQKRFVK